MVYEVNCVQGFEHSSKSQLRKIIPLLLASTRSWFGVFTCLQGIRALVLLWSIAAFVRMPASCCSHCGGNVEIAVLHGRGVDQSAPARW